MAKTSGWYVRRLLLVPLLLIGIGGAVYAASGVAGVARVARVAGLPAVVTPAPPPWYDATPLLVSLRPEARVGLAQVLGVTQTEDLPLYDLDLSCDPAQATFALGEEVWFTNTTSAPLPDLVLRIYANASPPDSGPQVRFVSGSCLDDARCGFSMASPSAIRVQLFAPLAPRGHLHFKLALTGALTRIEASRTNFLSQGLEGMRAVFGGGSVGATTGCSPSATGSRRSATSTPCSRVGSVGDGRRRSRASSATSGRTRWRTSARASSSPPTPGSPPWGS